MAETSRIEDLRRRVEKDPASIAFAQLAEEYRRAGDCEQAIRVCAAGLAHHPAYISARVTLGRALFELGRIEESRLEFMRVLDLAPDNLAAINKLSEIEQRLAPPPAEPPVQSAESGHAVEADPVVAELEAWLDVIDEDRRNRANVSG